MAEIGDLGSEYHSDPPYSNIASKMCRTRTALNLLLLTSIDQLNTILTCICAMTTCRFSITAHTARSSLRLTRSHIDRPFPSIEYFHHSVSFSIQNTLSPEHNGKRQTKKHHTMAGISESEFQGRIRLAPGPILYEQHIRSHYTSGQIYPDGRNKHLHFSSTGCFLSRPR